MGKSSNKKSSRPLTHEEIWDDSALIRSWDEAVEEYKLYHSIHARGENVEDVLREAEDAEAAQTLARAQVEVPHDEEMQETDQPTGEDTAPQHSHTVAMLTAEATRGTQDEANEATEAQQETNRPNVPEASFAQTPSVPQAVLEQVQDEGLKSLMMAWYFAGYYTGLYEAQQRAKTSPDS